jgi:hypothetical protein
MPRKGKCRRCETIDRMARLTLVAVPGHELSGMRVLMARHARFEFRVVVGGQALRLMALTACDNRMFPGQRISRRCVKLEVKLRRFEAFNGVACPAFNARCAGGELSGVLVGVTIDTPRATDGSAEV